MDDTARSKICSFYRLISGAPKPERADRSADGTLPMTAYRYCEAIASASAFGWYFYPPINFSLVWDGTEVAWTYEGAAQWEPVRGERFPDFGSAFAAIAPAGTAHLEPAFLSQGKLPGVVQIWSGYLARTTPGWALLSRGVANRASIQPYENYEGIVEADVWFGPLFTNVRLTRTNSPIDFHVHRPMFQVQPVSRPSYRDPGYEVLEAQQLSGKDWERFAATMAPNTDHMRSPGHYAVETRKRLRGEDAA